MSEALHAWRRQQDTAALTKNQKATLHE
jgi:hypothetical protein